jgi:hypothetical protein
MPRPRTNHEDVWAWAFDRTSNFNVRSAYKLLLEEGMNNEQRIEASDRVDAGINGPTLSLGPMKFHKIGEKSRGWKAM